MAPQGSHADTCCTQTISLLFSLHQDVMQRQLQSIIRKRQILNPIQQQNSMLRDIGTVDKIMDPTNKS